MMKERLRSLLLGITGFSFIGLLIELLLQGHTNVPLQWPPIILIILGLLGVVLGLLVYRRWVMISIRMVGAMIIVGAFLGVLLHLRAAIAAERELIGDAAVLGEVIRGVLLVYTPPLLAPGSLAAGGLILIACTYRHPVLEATDTN